MTRMIGSTTGRGFGNQEPEGVTDLPFYDHGQAVSTAGRVHAICLRVFDHARRVPRFIAIPLRLKARTSSITFLFGLCPPEELSGNGSRRLLPIGRPI